MGLTLRPLFGVVAQGMAFCRQGLDGGPCVIRVAFLRAKLASDFGGAQPGRQPGHTKLRVSLALAIDDRFDIGQQGGQEVFCTLTATGREGIQTRETTLQLMGTLPESHPAPAQCTFCAPLPP